MILVRHISSYDSIVFAHALDHEILAELSSKALVEDLDDRRVAVGRKVGEEESPVDIEHLELRIGIRHDLTQEGVELNDVFSSTQGGSNRNEKAEVRIAG